MKLIIALFSLIIVQTTLAQSFQSFSVFGGIEQKGFREPNFYGGNYSIYTEAALTLPSLRLGATYKLGQRMQLFVQLSNQKLYTSEVEQGFSYPKSSSFFNSQQRVLDVGVRRHKRYAPFGGYIGLNLLVSSTNMLLTETDDPILENKDLRGTARDFGLKFTWGKTKLIGNNFLIDWGISYQYYPTNLNFSSSNSPDNESYEFIYENDGSRTFLKDDFKHEMADNLIDKCGRIAFYFNIGFASIGIK